MVFYTVIMGIREMSSFYDANWVRFKEDKRSTSGYYVFVGENLVSWKSKKHSIVFRSCAEFEYRAMTHSVCEIMWLHQLLVEVGIETPVPTKTLV